MNYLLGEKIESIYMYTDLCRDKVNKLTDPTP